jgi:fatty acid desaturase
LLHHCNQYLTDPERDPESFYLSAQTWATLSQPARAYLWFYNTALGRLLLAPPTVVLLTLYNELKKLWQGDYRHIRAWLWHIPAGSIVLIWIVSVCRIPFMDYLLCYVYPGLMLTALRSFAEHRAAGTSEQRSVIIEAGPVLSLLYLGNHLHALHHCEPGIPWYRLSGQWRARRAELLHGNGHYYYRGYYEVLARHLLWAKESPYLRGDAHELIEELAVSRLREAGY